jgi:triosephosphate isomerase
MKKLIAGNWKMNSDMAGALKLASDIVSTIQDDPSVLENNDFLVCPPYPYLAPVQTELSMAVSLGAQDSSPFENGAYTGDVSAVMLKDLNCEYVILGHSERRQYYMESNLLIQQKAVVALEAGLKTIICVGETESQREAAEHLDIVEQQLAGSLPSGGTGDTVVVAYEPVWAIGTGKVATIEDITEMHAHIRSLVPVGTRILYGGSVKPTNAKEIFAVENVNGALIGGGSLKAEDFVGIAKAPDQA